VRRLWLSAAQDLPERAPQRCQGETHEDHTGEVDDAGLSQFRLAYLMGWEGTAPVVAIEKGKRRPRPDTLSALSAVLELSPADAAYLHGLAGHLDVTRLPLLAQIRRVLGRVEREIRHAPFPIAGEAATVAELGRRRAGVFDLVFDSRLPIRGNFSAPELLSISVAAKRLSYVSTRTTGLEACYDRSRTCREHQSRPLWTC
jgi:hypothetical protein